MDPRTDGSRFLYILVVLQQLESRTFTHSSFRLGGLNQSFKGSGVALNLLSWGYNIRSYIRCRPAPPLRLQGLLLRRKAFLAPRYCTLHSCELLGPWAEGNQTEGQRRESDRRTEGQIPFSLLTHVTAPILLAWMKWVIKWHR